MQKIGTKILKIILFIGVFGYLQYYDLNRGAHSMGSVTGGLMMAAAAYLLASLFGVVLSLTMNYAIAIIGTGALAMFLAFKLDEIIAATSWLTEGRVAVAFVALSVLCLIRDIRLVKASLTQPKTVGEPISPSEEDANVIMRRNMKSNPQSVLNLSNMLEEKWGRKPSYDEVMDYIDGLAIPDED